jgi:hypothetical protein
LWALWVKYTLGVLILGRKNKKNRRELSKEERRMRYARKKGRSKSNFNLRDLKREFADDDEEED